MLSAGLGGRTGAGCGGRAAGACGDSSFSLSEMDGFGGRGGGIVSTSMEWYSLFSQSWS